MIYENDKLFGEREREKVGGEQKERETYIQTA